MRVSSKEAFGENLSANSSQTNFFSTRVQQDSSTQNQQSSTQQTSSNLADENSAEMQWDSSFNTIHEFFH